MSADATPRPEPDRLLPADPEARATARRPHHTGAHEPVVSPPGHLDPRLLLAVGGRPREAVTL